MHKTHLTDHWKLLEAPLHYDAFALLRVLNTKDGWMDASLPCDVHMPLQAAKRIGDVALADYSFAAEWIERRSWWFVRRFKASKVQLCADVVELTLESLDAHADVFFNGTHLGAHISAHYPFTANIKPHLLEGENVLVVRMTTGLETVSDADLSELHWAVTHEEGNGCPERGDRRRAFVRKPQYAVGWDWGPKALTCGIVKDAYITAYTAIAIREMHVRTTMMDENAASLLITMQIENLHPYKTLDADICITLTGPDDSRIKCNVSDEMLTSGVNYIDIPASVPEPMIWWPNGYGAQPLYTAAAQVNVSGQCVNHPPVSFGIRTVALDTSRTDEKSRDFRFVINGIPIFAKGGDWIPADSIYARVTAEKYGMLIAEAQSANFNMLRIWGGGIYEADAFYDACDRCGILLWHDFMFSCSTYPDHHEWFRREVEREMDYQTKRLRIHPSMALWCGNNENHWIFNPEDNPGWNLDLSYDRQYGLFTSNVLAKTAVRHNCPEIPYWNSSPYGGDRPNSDFVGDVHHWGACMMNADMAKRIEPREYDKVEARFVSEYGYPGPCSIRSIAKYFDGMPIDRGSRVWDLHNNTFEKHTVAAGIEKHYIDGASALPLEDYLLHAGMVQSLMLGYSLEALRFKDHVGGALFWMYNDTWGEVGWTIIDYYLRRKIAYYGVKRAFAPVKLTLRLVGSDVVLHGANDTDQDVWLKHAQLGYLRFDGANHLMGKYEYLLPAHSRVHLDSFPLPDEDYTAGTFVVIPYRAGVDTAILRMDDTRNLHYPGEAPIVISTMRHPDRTIHVTLFAAHGYAHGVHIKEDYRCSDNYFDMLPGEKKIVTVELKGGEEPEWHIVR